MKLIIGLVTVLVSTFFWFGDFTVVDATSQDWIGGARGSGKGTNYHITLVAKKCSSKLTIDQLWIGEDFYEVEVFKDLANRSDKSFERKDTLHLVVSKLIRKGKVFGVSTYQKPPEHVGEAIIGFVKNGKRKYKVIKKLTKLARENRQ